ncbi:MAG: hypothetical protein PWP65_1027 [Clostridia bacterium]|nr:hypothetical protein [Clostridia bacterium]
MRKKTIHWIALAVGILELLTNIPAVMHGYNIAYALLNACSAYLVIYFLLYTAAWVFSILARVASRFRESSKDDRTEL